MRTLTLSELRTQIAERADIEIAATGRHTNTQALGLINESIQRYWLRLTNNGESALKSSDVTTVTGTTVTAGWEANQYVALPTDMLAVEGMSVYDGNVWLPMLPFEELERDSYEATSWSTTGLPTTFRLTLNNSGAHIARLMPRCDAAYTIRVLYVPSPTALSADGDEFSFYPGTSDFVVCDVALRLLTRDGAPESGQMNEIRAQRTEAERIITEFAHRLNRSSAPRVLDTKRLRRRNRVLSDSGYRGV